MRRVLVIALVLAGAAGVAIFGTGAGDSGGSYQVRAIFDTAAFAIAGEDVKIAGVKVGSIASAGVTKEKKAVLVLNIDEKGFQDFRADAHCTVRPQSLIGEKYVECTPTAPRPVGRPLPPKLHKITKGEGKGQYYLPVKNTSSPVDIDQLNDILRAPNQQRLALIIDEFGTGLAGNGRNLSDAIRRANPALQATDEVLNILASQNKVLGDLAQSSDTVLAPLSAQRQHVANFVVKANQTAQATAERRTALQANLRLLPRFLQELRPTEVRLSGLSDEMVPVLDDLHSQAPAINRLIIQLGPFSQAARPAIRTLGQASQAGIPATKAFNPIVNQLNQFTHAGRSVAANLAAILESVRSTGGVEQLMNFLFFSVSAVNGFDSLGHYLRAGLIVNLCSSYAVTPVAGCSANFAKNSEQTAAGATTASASSATAKQQAIAAAGDDPTLQRTARVLAGEKPQQVVADEARAKIEAQAAKDRQVQQAKIVANAARLKAKDARAKAAERRAALRARAICKTAKSDPGKAACASARRRASATTHTRAALDKAQIKPHGPIALPTVTLPDGLGAASPAQASSVAATTANPAPAAGDAGQGEQQGGAQDPQSNLFNYLLGN